LIHQASGALYYDELPVPNTSFKDIDTRYLEEFLNKSLERRIEDFGIEIESPTLKRETMNLW